MLRSRLEAARARLEATSGGRLLNAMGNALAPIRKPFMGIRQSAAGVHRHYRGLTKGWHRGIVYHDGRVTLDAEGLTLHGYYLPFGRKRIPYNMIRDARQWPLTGARAYRVHGPGWNRVWYPKDAKRAERSVGILLDIGTWFRPVVTPDDPQHVLSLLDERMAEASHP